MTTPDVATPRTDALAKDQRSNNLAEVVHWRTQYLLFARTLEKETIALREQLSASERLGEAWMEKTHELAEDFGFDDPIDTPAAFQFVRDRLNQLSAVTKERDALRANYAELIYQVSKKYPNETRHETALRYLKRAEESKLTGSAATKEKST